MEDSFIKSLFEDEERQPQTITELNRQLKRTLESKFSNVWLEAEITDFTEAASGHWYFTLHDGDSQIKGVCFKGTNWKIRFKPENGLEVRVRGKVSVYEPRGEYQVIVDSLKPVGEGALKIAFEQIRKKLESEGLFDPAHKRALPFLPKKVGVVTSPTGAAIHDVLNVLTRRTKTVDLVLIPALVQGDRAPASIRDGILLANRYNDSVDLKERIEVLIVGRGGGSMEDLSAFNEEFLARTIFESDIPIISAVGHEVDTSISDYVADLRAPTPSAAAEIVASSEDEIRSKITAFQQRAGDNLRFRYMRAAETLRALQSAEGFVRFPERLTEMRDQIDRFEEDGRHALRGLVTSRRDQLGELRRRLSPVRLASELGDKRLRLSVLETRNSTAVRKSLSSAEEGLGLAVAGLNALSPLAVLDRGYSLARDRKGDLVTASDDVAIGDEIEVVLKKGRLTAEVKKAIKE